MRSVQTTADVKRKMTGQPVIAGCLSHRLVSLGDSIG